MQCLQFQHVLPVTALGYSLIVQWRKCSLLEGHSVFKTSELSDRHLYKSESFTQQRLHWICCMELLTYWWWILPDLADFLCNVWSLSCTPCWWRHEFILLLLRDWAIMWRSCCHVVYCCHRWAFLFLFVFFQLAISSSVCPCFQAAVLECDLNWSEHFSQSPVAWAQWDYTYAGLTVRPGPSTTCLVPVHTVFPGQVITETKSVLW